MYVNCKKLHFDYSSYLNAEVACPGPGVMVSSCGGAAQPSGPAALRRGVPGGGSPSRGGGGYLSGERGGPGWHGGCQHFEPRWPGGG